MCAADGMICYAGMLLICFQTTVTCVAYCRMQVEHRPPWFLSFLWEVLQGPILALRLGVNRGNKSVSKIIVQNERYFAPSMHFT